MEKFKLPISVKCCLTRHFVAYSSRQIMIDNPDLSYEFVREPLLAAEEMKQGLTKRYVRKTMGACGDRYLNIV